MLTRLVTGYSWITAKKLLGDQVSDTTMWARRDEWIEAGCFGGLEAATAARLQNPKRGSSRGHGSAGRFATGINGKRSGGCSQNTSPTVILFLFLIW